MSLRNELDRFWLWAKMTSEEYAEAPYCGSWENEYGNWDAIYQAVSETIDLINADEVNHKCYYDLLLEVIAIENESNTTLIECNKRLKNAHLLYKAAIDCNQPNAKYNIAGFLKNETSKDAEIILRLLYTDRTFLVRFRALVSLSQINPNLAGVLALENLYDVRDTIRTLVFDFLIRSKSPFLNQALEILKNDSSPDIQRMLLQMKTLAKEQ